MAATRATFTLDRATMSRLEEVAERLALSRSEVVRKAVLEFYEKIGRLNERERLRMLRTFDEVVPRIPLRSLREVEQELEDIRGARRSGGRRSPAKRKS